MIDEPVRIYLKENNKVYVVMESPDLFKVSVACIHGVYSTREKANVKAERLRKMFPTLTFAVLRFPVKGLIPIQALRTKED